MTDPSPTQPEHAAGNAARDNHYVPQGLLQRWAPDGVQVHAYRTLVSHRNVPSWTLRSVRGSAYQRDLYTAVLDGQETDDIERWFADEFEGPGLDASDRLIRGQPVSRDDWGKIIGLVALQHLRTPQSFFEAMQRWEVTLPDILNDTTRELPVKWEHAKNQGVSLTADLQSSANVFAGLIDLRVDRSPDLKVGGAVVRTQVMLGRRFWLASIRHVLTGVAGKLLEHQWSVWEPALNNEWPITDDPSLRLNYYAADKYDFGGGWGKRGSELMMPISPRHLLYTQVGKPSRRRFTASLEHTRVVQRILAKRAYRWIFGTEPYVWVTQARPRVIDQDKYVAEKEMWNRWHHEQRASQTQPAPS